MNAKNYIGIAANQEYVGKIFGSRYGFKADDMIRPKDQDKELVEMTSNNKTLSKT